MEAFEVLLFEAVRNGDVETVRNLIAKGANVNARFDAKGEGKGGLTLSELLSKPNWEISEGGWDLSTINIVNLPNMEIYEDISKMLEEGRLSEGEKELIRVCKSGDLGTLARLLDDGINPDTWDSDGWTPLMFASKAGHLKIVKVLTDAGVSLRRSNSESMTAYELARTNNHPEVIELFDQTVVDNNPYEILGKEYEGERGGDAGPRWYCPYCGEWATFNETKPYGDRDWCTHLIFATDFDTWLNCTFLEYMEWFGRPLGWGDKTAKLVEKILKKQGELEDTAVAWKIRVGLEEYFTAAIIEVLDLNSEEVASEILSDIAQGHDDYWFQLLRSRVTSMTFDLISEILTNGQLFWAERKRVKSIFWDDPPYNEGNLYFSADGREFIQSLESDSEKALAEIESFEEYLDNEPAQVAVESIGPGEVRERKSQFTHIYRDAYTDSPWNESAINVAMFCYHLPEVTDYAGFRCVAAIESRVDYCVGFAFGYPAEADENRQSEIMDALGEENGKEWLNSCFLFSELALISPFKGKGIGGKLYEELLRDLPYRHALLTTRRDIPSAYQLFINRGWKVLAELPDYYTSGTNTAISHTGYILGLELDE